ncbi:MAG: hypothetical protein MUE99_01780 [Chitinophagaceae bacterium]|jgi:hypothetical protein|nr:hypothetical protein [Chitinophagaceae bacterium]
MKKWTIQLTLLLGFAFGLLAFSRYIAYCSPGGFSQSEIKNNAINKIQSAVDLRGMTRYLFDIHK